MSATVPEAVAFEVLAVAAYETGALRIGQYRDPTNPSTIVTELKYNFMGVWLTVSQIRGPEGVMPKI